jgi:hypothetical protein
LSLLALALAPAGLADIVYNPQIGSGSYTVVPGMDFNNPAILSYGGYTGGGGLFLAPSPFGDSTGIISPAFGAIGGGIAVTSLSTYSGPGTGVTWDGVLPVTGGQSYVLSAYVNVRPGTTGTVYIDLWDVPGDPNLQADTSVTGTWQFIHTTFTPAFDMVVGARGILDNNVTAGDSVWFDDIAITPAGSFVAPVAVPEPGEYAAVAGTLLLGVAAWRRFRR